MTRIRIYTRGGDAGKTSLCNGKRVFKDEASVQAYGNVDELNAFLGLLREKIDKENIKEQLQEIQKELFSVGAILANPAYQEKTAPFLEKIEAQSITRLEAWIDALEETLPPLTSFILPGGNEIASFAHIARCVCRRAERSIITLHRIRPQPENLLKFMNRLSDYLFVLARFLAGEKETFWK